MNGLAIDDTEARLPVRSFPLLVPCTSNRHIFRTPEG